KTAVAYKMAGAILRKYWEDPSKIVLWVDAEGAHDNAWAAKLLGGPEFLERLVVSLPETAQEALDITDMVIRSGDCVGVVVDSIEAMVPAEEVEGSFEDQQM